MRWNLKNLSLAQAVIRRADGLQGKPRSLPELGFNLRRRGLPAAPEAEPHTIRALCGGRSLLSIQTGLVPARAAVLPGATAAGPPATTAPPPGQDAAALHLHPALLPEVRDQTNTNF